MVINIAIIQRYYMKSLISTGLFLLLFVIGCTSDRSNAPSNSKRVISDSLDIPEQIRNLESLTVFPAGSQPSIDIQFQEEQEFGEQFLPNIPAPAMGTGPKVDVDQEGRVYMASRTQKTIQVYNPDGSELNRLGREGKGPGEFIDISGIDIYGNKLMVYDANLIRIQTFSLNSMQLARTIKLNSQNWSRLEEVQSGRPNTMYILSDSTFLAGVGLNPRNDRNYTGFYVLDTEGKIISDKIVETIGLRRHQFTSPNGRAASMRVSYSRKGVVKISGNGNIYHANTGELAIKIFDTDGTYRRAVYHPFDNDPLEEDEVLENYPSSLHGTMREAGFPQTWPALESILVDDNNRIWISTIIDDKEIYEWLVLDPSGELLTTVTWPREEDIEIVRDGKMYVSITDYEAGVKRVIRYGIEMESNNP
jgi:hypothetical protein